MPRIVPQMRLYCSVTVDIIPKTWYDKNDKF